MGLREAVVPGTKARLDKKLAGYTLIGAAAFTVTGVAHANSVTYVPNVNTTVDQNDATNSYTINLGSSGSEIVITASGEDVSAAGFNGASLLSDGLYLAALSQGQLIDLNGGMWTTAGDLTLYKAGSPPKYKGEFSPTGGDAYLAFYFTDTGGQKVGWVDLTTNSSATDSSFTVNRYAYENDANVPLPAGELSTTPEPSTLSLLALGGAGLLAVRRRRAVHA